MPKKRQPVDLEEGIEIRSLASGFSPGFIIDPHFHDWHQLVYATRGVMTVNTSSSSWVVPPHRAVWVPAKIDHEVEMVGSVSLRTLYIKVGLSTSLPSQCCVVNVSPLLRELIVHTIKLGMLNRFVPAQKRLIGVILDQLEALRTVPLKLPMPQDARAARVAQLVRSNPSENKSLDQLSSKIGASKRTIERLFLAETEMTFGKWRQQLRLLHALKLLAAGENVTTAAFAVGYDSTSAFIYAFKTALGTTPGRYYSEKLR
ncbi:MAG TPA: helix-turn-helix transcriptional regulator [Pyrinomonadaceae bacterium]|nr:helix-turn-helix transcriptional regulator [Pyrinomonadaceae bacterium]